MADPTPFAAYYRTCVGRWRGSIHVEVTSWRAFFRTPMGLLDRVGLVAGVVLGRLIGPPTMSTSMQWPWKGDEREAMHTTRVHQLGATLMQSEELFLLKPDSDTAFVVRGEVRLAGASRNYGGSNGDVQRHAMGAHYHFDLFSGLTEQRTALVDADTLAVVQVSSWSRTSIILVRYETTV